MGRLGGALLLASLAVTNARVLHQFTAAQDAQLQALQEQASSAQAQAAQAADQLDNAQTQVAEASDQLASQNTQVSTLNTKQQTNVQELAVLLPTTPSGAPAPGPESAQAQAALKRLEANSAMEGGIANLAASYVASPPPPMIEASPPPPLVYPSPPPPPPHPHPPTPLVGFEAPVDEVVAKGSVSFAPGTTTYWETVSAPVPAPARTLGFTRRLAQASSTDAAAFQQAELQEQQVIAAANAQAAQDAAQAAHDQAVAENMQEQQAKAEANAEAEQATMLVQSQTLDALTAPAPAPTTSTTTTTTDTATASHSALKAKEASSSMEGSVASMASL